MGDIIVLIALFTVIALVVLGMIKNKKSGKKCSCGCGECVMKDHCHGKTEKSKN